MKTGDLALLINLKRENARLLAENSRLEEICTICYAGLGGECDLPEVWLDVLFDPKAATRAQLDAMLPYSGRDFEMELANLRLAIANAAQWLDDAAIELQHWGSYADACWQKKHDLAGLIADIKHQAAKLRHGCQKQTPYGPAICGQCVEEPDWGDVDGHIVPGPADGDADAEPSIAGGHTYAVGKHIVASCGTDAPGTATTIPPLSYAEIAHMWTQAWSDAHKEICVISLRDVENLRPHCFARLIEKHITAALTKGTK